MARASTSVAFRKSSVTVRRCAARRLTTRARLAGRCPKKPTHRHKNVPMRVLKFYKVEGDSEGTEYKVSHERIECPHPDCGAGVFMAQHKDRQTCGKFHRSVSPRA